MNQRRNVLWNRFGLRLSVLLLVLSLSIPAGISLAASTTPSVPHIPDALPEGQEDIPSCGGLIVPLGGCNKIQVVVMIDQSFSMPRNDPQQLRFFGAENLADLLAHRYLEALTAQVPPPTIELAVLHFGTDAPQQYNSGWVTIAPESEEIWSEQFEQLKTKISPEELKRRGLNATNFINPFGAARDLLAQANPQDQGCPQRVILLLTDGAPAGARVLTGAALESHMDEVDSIAQEGMTGEGNFIYVTAFNVRGDDYWGESKPHWTRITGDSATTDPPRSKQEDTPQDVASRMEKIVATHLGYQSFSVEAGLLVFPAYLQSMRITYYAPNPAASFTLVDPDGNAVVPDGENIILTGEGTPIQALVIKFPKPGSYQLTTSVPGGIITLLPTFLQFTPMIETSPSALQQFTSSEIQLTLLDSSGNPITLVDDPVYQLDLRAAIQQGDQTWPLSLSDEGGSFTATFLPVSASPARMDVTATLQDAQGQEVCRLLVEPSGELSVSPVTFHVGEASVGICTPSQMPVTYPLALINADTQMPAVISVPVDWEVSSSLLSGDPVEASINETGSGQYQLSLRPDEAGDIRTSLAASAEVEGQGYLFFEDELFTTGLLEDRSLAFELGEPGTIADPWSLFFNLLFKPWIKDYSGEILIGRRLFGWLGPQDVTISGRFFDQVTGDAEADIQRFFVQLAPEAGGSNPDKENGWIPGGDGMYILHMPAPPLGAYRVDVIDEGEVVACTTMAGLPAINLLLINDFWEYIFWIVLILLALLLLAWLIRLLVCRYVNPPWGRLELIDPNGQVVWTGHFDSEDEENAVRSCYVWRLRPPVFGIVKIKARSWDQPRHWVRIEVRRVDGRQVFRGNLDRWEDANLENDLRITWRKGAPGIEKPPIQ